MKTFVAYACCLIGICTVARSASAQERHTVRLSVNFGMQEGTGRLALNTPLTAPGGTGFFEIDDRLTTSATLDASASLRVWKHLALGAGFTRIRTERLAHPYTASIPPPVTGRLNLPSSGVASNLAHGERSVYALASWTAMISDRFDVVFSGGPVFFDVRQGLPNATAAQSPAQGPVLFVTNTEFSESTTGLHIGMDLDYVFGRRAGLGALIRYTRGSLDIPNGTQSMTVGGFQILAGLRVKL